MKMSGRILILCFVLISISGAAEAQQNYKIRQTMSMNGQKMESTVYVRGSRKRTEGGAFMGMGGDVADVEQCDLKRNLKISDKKKMYAVEPFDDGTDTPTPTKSQIPNQKSKIEKGGTVTYISNITDTGERKQMFGLTARHIKTSMTMEASPDACMKENMKIETDGWYVDLPSFSCPITVRPQMPQMPTERTGGCRDKMLFKTSGGGKLGFPLTETRTIGMGDGDMSFTQTVETLEFSKATLDAALFDIPNGYTLTANSQDLYGKPDMAAMMRNMGGNDDDKPKAPVKSNSMPKAKKAGTIRIGVYAPTNKAGENISTTNMQSFLVQKLTGGNVEAIAVGSESDARNVNCDYVLTSDFSKLKQSTASKIGGMFGKVTGTDTSAAKNYDAQVDFKLVSLIDGKTVQNKASNKTESDVDRAAESVLALEAQQIISAIKK
jgi:hypothetical protein